MKRTVQCLDCSEKFTNNDEIHMLTEMQKHYYAEHNEIITQVSEKGKVEWMVEFTKRWNNAQ